MKQFDEALVYDAALYEQAVALFAAIKARQAEIEAFVAEMHALHPPDAKRPPRVVADDDAPAGFEPTYNPTAWLDQLMDTYGVRKATVPELVQRLHDACKPGGALSERQCLAVREIMGLRFGSTITEATAGLTSFFAKHAKALKTEHAALLNLRG